MPDRLEALLTAYTQTIRPDHLPDTEALLRYLRGHGCSLIDSIQALMIYHQLSLGDAKARVHLSTTWADMRETHDHFHDLLEQVAQELSDTQNHDH
jgi:hypothetical protein